MFNKPIKASSMEIELFTSGKYGDDIEALEFEINAWLKSQPKNIVVQDIIYRHCGRVAKGKDIVSVMIISGPEEKS